MLVQISIYTENRKGAAREILSILAAKSINILSLVSSDSGEFGTMRLITSDADTALEELSKNHYLCRKDNVIATELEDKPGSLEKFLSHIEKTNIDISYMYVGYMREAKTPVIIMHCEDIEIVEKNLQANGYIVF
ncbi:MAG: ACT domain-containing protein [Lachnospiraceae bacterium]|nr:ACT domain-containing protein [Lachnospiraceae bacterium]